MQSTAKLGVRPKAPWPDGPGWSVGADDETAMDLIGNGDCYGGQTKARLYR